MPKVIKTKETVEKTAKIAKEEKKVEKKTNALSVPTYSLDGKEVTSLNLPEEVFGAKVNKDLIAQAVRVYTTNLKTFTGSTKTRGEVAGTTAKMFRQKGTGRARHGAAKAPIFVGGGISFGPKPRAVRLALPTKMKKAALFAALSAKTADSKVLGLTGAEKASGKTKEVAGFVQKVAGNNKNIKSTLIITGERQEKLAQAAKNIPGVQVMPLNLLNAYEVIKHQVVAVTKDAVEKLAGGKA